MMLPPRMTPHRVGRPLLALALALTALSTGAPSARAQDSAMVRLLKGGKVPEERQGSVVEMIGRRGNAGDLQFLFSKAIDPKGFGPKVRLQALEALAEATRNRKLRPEGDLAGLATLIAPEAPEVDEPTRLAAVRLAGLWALPEAAPAIRSLAEAKGTSPAAQAAALEALGNLGDAGREAISALAGPDRPWATRVLAVAALAKGQPEAARDPAVRLLAETPELGDPTPLVAAFLNRQGGADLLAAGLAAADPKLPADAAKRALRSVYALGRADATLVTALSEAAGLDAEVQPLTEAEMAALIAEVQQKGNPERGEAVFRRADLNCTQCHALAGAGGGVGPELSGLGASSPYDYIINNLILPDASIKEEYITLVVQTTDGQIYQGIVTDKDEQRLVLKEASGATRTIPASEVEESRPGGSLMPKGLTNLMTRQELVDLVKFLGELGKPGPYAVRATPMLQRWQYLTQIPAGPELHAVEAQADAWLPIFARVNGSLPLDEVAAKAPGDAVFVRGEIEVTKPGPVQFTLDDAAGVTAWIDNARMSAGSKDLARDLPAGKHTLTLKVEPAKRPAKGVSAVVGKPAGSGAEFRVISGR